MATGTYFENMISEICEMCEGMVKVDRQKKHCEGTYN